MKYLIFSYNLGTEEQNRGRLLVRVAVISVFNWRLTAIVVGPERLELSEVSSLNNWLDSVKVRLDDATGTSFVLWLVINVSGLSC